MGLLSDAARKWNEMCSKEYYITVARKRKKEDIVLKFRPMDFYHLAGMQYASDVDFKLNRNEYDGEKLLKLLISGKFPKENAIEKSVNWKKINGRLNAIRSMNEILENDFEIFLFDPLKVQGYCRIDAKYVIKDKRSGAIFFLFLSKTDDNCYFCRSAFEMEDKDYTLNQLKMKLLSVDCRIWKN